MTTAPVPFARARAALAAGGSRTRLAENVTRSQNAASIPLRGERNKSETTRIEDMWCLAPTHQLLAIGPSTWRIRRI